MDRRRFIKSIVGGLGFLAVSNNLRGEQSEIVKKVDMLGIQKAELHCHVDGLLCPKYLEKLHEKGKWKNIKIEELKKLYPVKDKKDWFSYMKYVDSYQSNNGELLLDVLKLYIKDLESQNVTYSEIMLSGFLFQYKNIEETAKLFQKYRTEMDKMDGIEVNFLIAISRTKNRNRMEKQAKRIIELYKRNLICGVVLAGDERACKVEDYKDIFDLFHENGIPVEIHAGEWGGPETIWDALKYGKAKRIGHGLSAFKDPKLIDYIIKNDIHIEFCPTSNKLLTDYNVLNEHPIKIAIDKKMNFSINTDDPGPFGCTMLSEFSDIQKEFDLDKLVFEKIYKDSIRSAFKK